MRATTSTWRRILAWGLAWVAFAQASLAFAGGVDGGGAGAIECTPPDTKSAQLVGSFSLGKIQLKITSKSEAYKTTLTNGRKYQLLEFWEASNGFGPFLLNPVEIINSNENVDKQVARAVQRLIAANSEFGNRVAEAVIHVRRRILPTRPDFYVTPPSDTGVRSLPRGCEIHGFGSYSDTEDNLEIDPTIEKEVTPTDVAGLFVHEAVYKVLRDLKKDQTSWRTRRIVGLMFSTRPLVWHELENGFGPAMTIQR